MAKDKNVEGNKKDKPEIKKAKHLIIGIIGVLFSLVIFVLGTTLSAYFSVNWVEAIVIAIMLVALGIVTWVIVTRLVLGLMNGSNLKNFIDEKKDTPFCEHANMICCFQEALKEGAVEIDMNDLNFDAETRIYTEKQINAKEMEGDERYDQWKDILIFSRDLSTELKNGLAEPILIYNCSKGVKYSIFYLDTVYYKEEISQRKNDIYRSLNKASKVNVKFYPIEAGSEELTTTFIGRNTLPLLSGVVLFSNSSSAHDDSCYYKEGFLSLRKDLKHAPIFYKMTKCMLEQYAKYFKDIIKEFNSKKEN